MDIWRHYGLERNRQHWPILLVIFTVWSPSHPSNWSISRFRWKQIPSGRCKSQGLNTWTDAGCRFGFVGVCILRDNGSYWSPNETHHRLVKWSGTWNHKYIYERWTMQKQITPSNYIKVLPSSNEIELKLAVLIYRLLYRITLKRLCVWAQRSLESKLLLKINRIYGASQFLYFLTIRFDDAIEQRWQSGLSDRRQSRQSDFEGKIHNIPGHGRYPNTLSKGDRLCAFKK